jgi:hypothetical protein
VDRTRRCPDRTPRHLDRTRRRLLATLGTAGLAALAGCDAVVAPDEDDRSDTPASSATPPAALPYEGDPPRTLLSSPRGVRLRNATGAAQFVTLALDHGDRQVFLDSREVPPATVVRYDGLVRRVGDYRVVAETAAGERHERTWRPAERTGGLLVTMDDGVRSRVTTTCVETCGPESSSADRTLYLDNSSADETTARVRLGPSWNLDRDLSVRVPGLGRAAVPVPEWSSDYPLRIAYGDREVEWEWRVSDGTDLFVSVDGPPRVRCSNTVRELVVVNRPDRDRSVDLRIDADGRRAVERSLAVPASGERSFADAVPPAGRYAFEVRTGDGIDRSFETAICPAAGPLLVILDEEDAVVTVRGERRETVVDWRD